MLVQEVKKFRRSEKQKVRRWDHKAIKNRTFQHFFPWNLALLWSAHIRHRVCQKCLDLYIYKQDWTPTSIVFLMLLAWNPLFCFWILQYTAFFSRPQRCLNKQNEKLFWSGPLMNISPLQEILWSAEICSSLHQKPACKLQDHESALYPSSCSFRSSAFLIFCFFNLLTFLPLPTSDTWNLTPETYLLNPFNPRWHK